MRVLVTPRMYRQAIAFSIQRRRTGLEVRIASPEATGRELADLRPHLLVHNDGLGPEALTEIPFRIEVQYSNGMDAQISAECELSTVRDMTTEDLRDQWHSRQDLLQDLFTHSDTLSL